MIAYSNNKVIKDLGGEGTMLWSPLNNQLGDISQVLGNKIVLLYFGARWCGPCKRFTPVLETFYKAFKRSRVLADARNRREIEEFEQENFEIVFLSMDHFVHEYQSYASDMPWWCAPYNQKTVLDVADKYGRALSCGIPHLVVVDKDGSVILDNGVEEVTTIVKNIEANRRRSSFIEPNIIPPTRLSSAASASIVSDQHVIPPPRLSSSSSTAATITMSTKKQERRGSYKNNQCNDLSPSFYFWKDKRPKHNLPLAELLPETYLRSDGTAHPMKELEDKYIMLFFCARWCPPCQTFTPLLNKVYESLKKNRKDFEILYVSFDSNKQDFTDFFSEMKFCALPYNKPGDEMTLNIAKKLGVDGTPTLVMLGPCSNTSSASNDDAGSMEGSYCVRRPDGGWECFSGDGNPSSNNNNTSGKVIDREVINTNVRGIIEQGQADYISEFPYHPRNYGNLNSTTGGNVNIEGEKCIIVFHEGAYDDEKDNTRRSLKMAAKNYKGKDSMNFYWVFADDDAANSESDYYSDNSDTENKDRFSQIVRETLRLGKPKDTGQHENPVMVLLDLPNGGVFYLSTATEISVNSILDFIKSPGKKLQI